MKCLEDGAVKNSRDEKEEEEVQKKKCYFMRVVLRNLIIYWIILSNGLYLTKSGL